MNGVLLVKKKKKKKWRTGWSTTRRGRGGGGIVSKRRERKISGNACRHGKIVRWHLISPRILRANEINYRVVVVVVVIVPLSRAEETRGG